MDVVGKEMPNSLERLLLAKYPENGNIREVLKPNVG